MKIDPATLQDRLEYYPADDEGFRHVKRLDNIYFEKIDWKIENYMYKNSLFVVSSNEIPDFNRFHDHFSLLTKLTNDQVDRDVEFWNFESF